MDLVDFTDRKVQIYAAELRRCVDYMFATLVVSVVRPCPGNEQRRTGPSLIAFVQEVLIQPVEADAVWTVWSVESIPGPSDS